MSRIATLTNPSQLLQTVESLTKKSSTNPIFVYINSTIKPETNRPWCPDCEAFDPILKSLYTAYNLTVLIASVDRATWKQIDQPTPHYFLTCIQTQTTCIPTLYKIDPKTFLENKPWEKLTDPELHDKEKLDQVVSITSLSINKDNKVLEYNDVENNQ